jgi:hypothetical protein
MIWNGARMARSDSSARNEVASTDSPPAGSVDLEHVTALLQSLADRAQGEKPELDMAVGVVADLGRIAYGGQLDEIRAVQSRMAVVRERLNYAEGQQYPAAALRGASSHVFLAGALWALSEVFNARLLQAGAAKQTTASSQRAVARDLALRTLGTVSIATPAELLDRSADEGLSIRPDQLSRALGELLSEGHIHVAPAPPTGDRRNRHYSLGPSAADAG